jgi:hypothetical protein
MELLSRSGWWYQETIWFRALVYLTYPAGELTPLVLNKLEVPRLDDVPLTWRDQPDELELRDHLVVLAGSRCLRSPAETKAFS